MYFINAKVWQTVSCWEKVKGCDSAEDALRISIIVPDFIQCVYT